MNTNNYIMFFTKIFKPLIIVFAVLIVSCSAKTNKNKRVQTDKAIEQESKKDSISNEATAISDENNKPNDIKNNLSAPVQEIAKTIRWFGQASVKFESKGKTIFVDPYMITGQWTADYIFITHSHEDHLSIHDIERIKKTDTKIFASQDCEGKLSSFDLIDITYVLPGEVISISDNFTIETVPSYNINKYHHPKANQWVGYIIDVDGVRIYHPGDTDKIPEMKKIKSDIVFMPLGQTYTMNSLDDAIEVVMDIKPELAIPFHYGIYEGSKEDADKFKQALSSEVNVLILKY